MLEDSDKLMRAKRIETAWHGVWLRALEWECLLEHTGGEETEEGIILQSDSANIEEDILKNEVANKNVTIVKSPSCPGEISSSTECDIMTASKLKHLDSSDCEGVSSDSGFSDLSGYLPILLAENPHIKCKSTEQKRLKSYSRNRHKPKKRKNRLISVGTEYSQNQKSWKYVFSLLILLLFSSILLYSISCNNNICAININTHINYYNNHHPI